MKAIVQTIIVSFIYLLIFALLGLCGCTGKSNKVGTKTNQAQSITTFTASPDTLLIYVSQSGNYSTASPVEAASINVPYNPSIEINSYKSLSAAIDAARDGFSDWALLKRGDIWTNESFSRFNKLDRSATEPLLTS